MGQLFGEAARSLLVAGSTSGGQVVVRRLPADAHWHSVRQSTFNDHGIHVATRDQGSWFCLYPEGPGSFMWKILRSPADRHVLQDVAKHQNVGLVRAPSVDQHPVCC